MYNNAERLLYEQKLIYIFGIYKYGLNRDLDFLYKYAFYSRLLHFSALRCCCCCGVTAGAWRRFSAALAMRMGGVRAHQLSYTGRGVDAPRWRQGIGAIDLQTTLLPPRRVGSCPSPTFRSYVASVGGGYGVRSGIGWGLFGRLFGGGPVLLLGVGSCIKQSSEDGWATTAFLIGG